MPSIGDTYFMAKTKKVRSCLNTVKSLLFLKKSRRAREDEENTESTGAVWNETTNQKQKQKHKSKHMCIKFCLFYFVEKARLYGRLRAKPLVNNDKYCGGNDEI